MVPEMGELLQHTDIANHENPYNMEYKQFINYFQAQNQLALAIAI